MNDVSIVEFTKGYPIVYINSGFPASCNIVAPVASPPTLPVLSIFAEETTAKVEGFATTILSTSSVVNLRVATEFAVNVVENGLLTFAVFVVPLYDTIYLLSPAEGPESIVITAFRYALLVDENLLDGSKN